MPIDFETDLHREAVAHKEVEEILHETGEGHHEAVHHEAHHMVYHIRLEVALHSHHGEVVDGDQACHGDTAALDNQSRRLDCHKTAESCDFGEKVTDKTGA